MDDIILVDEIDLGRGSDIIHIVPIDISLATVETEPCGMIHIVLFEELLPLLAGFVVGFGEDSEGGDIVLVAILLENLVNGGNHMLAVAAGRRPEDEEFPLGRHSVERVGHAEGIVEHELGGLFADEQALPFGGTHRLLFDRAGRRPKIEVGGKIIFDHVDINLVIDHDVGLEVFLGEVDDEILENIGRVFGPLEEGVDVGDDDLGAGVFEDIVEIIHHTVGEYLLGSVDDGVVFEGDIVEIMVEIVLAALPVGELVALAVVLGGIDILGTGHHDGEERLGVGFDNIEAQTVETAVLAVAIGDEGGRIHAGGKTIDLMDDGRLLAVEVEEELVLGAALGGHVGGPVLLVGLEMEKRFLAIDDKLDIIAAGVGKETESLGQFLLVAGEMEQTFFVEIGSIDDPVALAVIVAEEQHGVAPVVDFDGEVVVVFFLGLHGKSEHEGKKDEEDFIHGFHCYCSHKNW